MPLLALFSVACAIASASPVLAESELRTTLRSPFHTYAFRANTTFVLFVVLPVATAAYVLVGDWAVSYVIATQAVPSALALGGFLFATASVVLAFLASAVLVRSDRGVLAWSLSALFLTLAVVALGIGAQRSLLIGSHDQFRFGTIKPASGRESLSLLAVAAAVLGGGVEVLRAVYSRRRKS